MSFLERSKEEHEQFLMLGALDCGIFLLDRNLTTIWINRWLEESLSDAEPPWLGKSLGELLREASEDGDIPSLDGLRESGPRKWILPHPSPRRAGGWLEVSVSALASEGDAPTGAIGKVEDISERLRTEERLLEEIRHRRILVEQSRDGIVILEENGSVYEANQRYADMLGYSLEEVHQLWVWDWDALHTREVIEEMIEGVDATGDHFVTQHRRKDGTVIDVEISTNGSMCGDRKLIFCVCRDITKRRRKEQERERLIEKLQRASVEAEGLPDILSLCAFCKRVRNEAGDWEDIEAYLDDHIQRQVSHGICLRCLKEHYSELGTEIGA